MTEEMGQAIEYSEAYIGECIVGECDRPATVRVYENFVLCALHYLAREIAEAYDEASLASELMAGWRSVAVTHHNGFLLELFEYASKEATEQKGRMEAWTELLARADLESDPNERLRSKMGRARAGEEPSESSASEAFEAETEGIGAIGRVVGELARGRGFVGLKDLAAAVNGATGEDYTAEELADWPRPGFGGHLDAVLGLSEEDRERLVAAVVERIHE